MTLPPVTARRRRDMERLALRVLPELEAAPLYLINSPQIFRDGPICAFRGSKQLDLHTFGELQQQLEWRGPGNTIVFCKRISRDKMLGTLLHELAHKGLSCAPDIEATPLALEFQAEIMTVGQRVLAHPPDDGAPRWYPHHDLQFTRVALHLHQRAWSHGYVVPLPAISVAGRFYGLSPAWRYLDALGDEPRRLRDCTIEEIEAAPVPDEFAALWAADTAEFTNKELFACC